MRADDFGMVARHWRGIADDEMSKLDAREIHERRNLHVHQSLFGMGVLEGDLDADGTKILLEALDHCAPPDATGGPVPPRSLAQRRADALVDICGAYLSGNAEGTVPVNLNVTMDHGTLTGSPPADPRQVRCELEGFGPIPLATAFRLACDCSVTRVLMRGESEVLDLGRSTRLASAAQHKALAIRDRGCVSPAVTGRPPGATRTTSSGGNTAAPPTNRTSVCCVAATTPSATKAAGASPATRRRHLRSPRTTRRPHPHPTTRTRTHRRARADSPPFASYATAVASISIMSSGNARRATPSRVPAGATPAAPVRAPTAAMLARNSSTSVV